MQGNKKRNRYVQDFVTNPKVQVQQYYLKRRVHHHLKEDIKAKVLVQHLVRAAQEDLGREVQLENVEVRIRGGDPIADLRAVRGVHHRGIEICITEVQHHLVLCKFIILLFNIFNAVYILLKLYLSINPLTHSKYYRINMGN